MPIIQIIPKDVSTIHTAKTVHIKVDNINLYQNARIVAHVYDINEQFVEYKIFYITGNDYMQWFNDDSYIVNYVLTYFGFTVDNSLQDTNENKSIIFVNPKEVTVLQTVNCVSIDVDEIDLYKSVQISANALSTENKTVESRKMILEGEEYTNWSNDDTYIVDYVIEKFGFVKTV